MMAAINSTFPFGLFIAMVTGLFGATFFMLIQLQQKMSEAGLTDARDMWTWPLILLRCLVGVGAASILYFFFRSGLLEGSLWPALNALGFDGVAAPDSTSGSPTLYVPNKDFALLIVWSFIAGYSQTLVPNLLIATEARQGKAP